MPNRDPTDSTAIRPSPLEDFLNEAEQETLIKKMPDGWEDEIATQLRPQAWAADEQETVIKKPPGDLDEEDLPTATHSSPSKTSGRIRTSSGARRKSSAASRARQRGLVAVLMILCLGIGGMGGALATALLLILIGFRPVASDAPINRDPVIQVVAPSSTQITLDGEAVGKDIEVVPGAEHTLEVTLQDHEPWTTELTLNRGEHRVLIITPAEAQAANE